jgi:type III secretory pathway component EscR
MSNITTTNGFSPLEVEAMQKLPEYQRLYIQVKNEQKIIHMDKQDALTKLFALIINTIELSGENKKYNLDNEQTKKVANFIYETVLEQYKGATMSELQSAFKMGLFGNFGDFVGYGVITFGKFIKGYFNSPQRDASIKAWLKFQNAPVTVNKPVYKFFEKNMEIANYFFNICTEKLSERFDTVINHDDNVMHLPSIYMFLYDNFQISFTHQSKEIIKRKAKERYHKFIVKSKIKESDPKGFETIVQSVIESNNLTFEWYMKTQALIFLTLKLKEQGKTYDNLKTLK